MKVEEIQESKLKSKHHSVGQKAGLKIIVENSINNPNLPRNSTVYCRYQSSNELAGKFLIERKNAQLHFIK